MQQKLREQTELINSYQNEICNKVSTMRQSMDHLYNINNPHQNHKGKGSNKNKQGNDGTDLKENNYNDGLNIGNDKSKGKMDINRIRTGNE